MTGTGAERGTVLGRAAAIGVVALVGLLVAGHVLGVPIGLGYVETGSMEPTIDAGDGFVAVPTAIAGPVEEGDVVVYDAQEIEGGGLTTHRVVEETDHGYVTRGDANPFTDQDGGEPHVTDGQIAAKALQVNGEVVTIPHLGTAAMTVQGGLESAQWWLASTLGIRALAGSQGLSYLLLGFGLLVIVLSAAFDGRGTPDRDRSRSRTRIDAFDARRLVVGMGALVFVVALATMVAMSGSVEIGLVSAEFDSERPDVVPAGETKTHSTELRHGGAMPVVSITEPASNGIDVDDDPRVLTRGESVDATVALTAPSETGYYLRSYTDHRYFAVLPPPLIARLHAVHPWVAMTGVATVLTGLVVSPFALLAGTGTIRTRSRRRSDSTGGFLR
ncbi:S26 family signal peptidase [Natrinema sp. 1APR25-10V2]|uniref:S26 family signal peptidase n=1 Tax=Natrinema sp. 1APR25-10V2 TaxID=2951081 RepID=UPI0028764027|nr:S26 family signal peptidase [Natrinema sp. 1APR25-10V2]MDS0473661.1 S26 family signal peptidase [Natrinema sp. 1APR25-10V2]